ncbi:L,D-transpeptidase family protein [Erythrobacter gaetbuli]|uniref:L,D-transpeptidase family protein n=1 Tax=Qipengyuania gaetbuli TaxID=266952 RepID=A0A844Y2T8_9SPHN|nr:L,D-transpeptidase family protein [Qipengyuania gaetbuli]MXO51392.1 L,D-transpeptidase family protein [Qipengyuania gaetbuli]
MTAILKWVGGTTFVIALGIAALAYGVSSQAEPEAIAVPAAASIEPEGAILAKLEADARRPFTIRRVLPIEGPIKYGEWHWDDEAVPEGPLLITVDLQARTISIFRDGYEIGAAAVMLGTDEHPTPTGTFPILTKERHNVSEKYGNAPMPWTLRLTWDGIAIHGGSEVENGYASHGCVAIPDPLAAKLFEIAQKGDKVIITDGKRIGVGDPII